MAEYRVAERMLHGVESRRNVSSGLSRHHYFVFRHAFTAAAPRFNSNFTVFLWFTAIREKGCRSYTGFASTIGKISYLCHEPAPGSWHYQFCF